MSLKFAILGFLALDATSGYTLQQRFDASVSSFWSVTQSQIYRELKDLERDGWVCSEIVPGHGRPARNVYSVTPRGTAALQQWLREPVEPQQIRHPLLLKLAFSGLSDPAVGSTLLEEYHAELGVVEASYQDRAGAAEIFGHARTSREALIWQLILENGLSWVRAERAWAARAIGVWKEETRETE